MYKKKHTYCHLKSLQVTTYWKIHTKLPNRYRIHPSLKDESGLTFSHGVHVCKWQTFNEHSKRSESGSMNQMEVHILANVQFLKNIVPTQFQTSV